MNLFWISEHQAINLDTVVWLFWKAGDERILQVHTNAITITGSPLRFEFPEDIGQRLIGEIERRMAPQVIFNMPNPFDGESDAQSAKDDFKQMFRHLGIYRHERGPRGG